MRKEHGFTVIELLAVSLIALTLLGLSATAARHYWFVRSLQGAQDQVVAELRELQQRSQSRSHPQVYGIRLRPGSQPGTASQIGVVRYDYSTGSCAELTTRTLDAGVYVSAASFTDLSPGPTQACRAGIPGAGSDKFAFVFARGSATAGSVTLRHPSIGDAKTVSLSQLTGRVSTS